MKAYDSRDLITNLYSNQSPIKSTISLIFFIARYVFLSVKQITLSSNITFHVFSPFEKFIADVVGNLERNGKLQRNQRCIENKT